MNEQWLSPKAYGAKYSATPETVIKWCKEGRVRYTEVNGRYKVADQPPQPAGTYKQEAPVLAASKEPEGPWVPTQLQKLQADTAEKEARLANQKATAEVEKWDEREEALLAGERELEQGQAALALEREELAEERERVKSLEKRVNVKAAEVLKVKEETVPRAEERAEEILTEAFVQVGTMKREAEEEIANSRAVRDATLEAAKVQIARAEQTIFDADQLRILQSRVAALPDKVRAKHFPKADRAFLPLPGDKGMPVSDPDKRVEVVVDRGFTIPDGFGMKMADWGAKLILGAAIAGMIWVVVMWITGGFK